ncbi:MULTISPECIES: glycosyltransferase family 4 protein [unclassified Carboxylicivirga]|uniref:glycosyltransferase family 4 protein n=1 Tax=Carboxylicivirga TaxID=1628153 RepID=UPI003D335E43
MDLNKVLFIGPYHSKAKGGVNSVLCTYQKFITGFSCVSTFPFYYKLVNYLLSPFILVHTIFSAIFSTRKIIHIHGASYGSFFRKYIIYKFVSVFSNKKIVYHIHGANFELFSNKASYFTRICLKDFIENVDQIICLSESWKNYFTQTYNIKRIAVVNNIVPKPNIIEKQPTNNEFVKFLFLGRIGDRKGVFDLIESIAKHRDYLNGNFKLFIGGDGEIQRLQREIKEREISDLVEYVGWVDGRKKEHLLNNSDVYILPSYNEGLPISILEAMSYGLPIISTTVGGIPEVIKGNGFVIEPGNQEMLFRCIKQMIEVDRHEYSYCSKGLIRSFYPENVISQLSKIYIELLYSDRTKNKSCSK